MKRRVIKHGPATYVISLPSTWVKNQGIKKGQEIEVVEQDSKLIVGSEVSPEQIEVKMDISGLDRTSILYIIRGFYRLGYNTVRLSFDNTTTIHLRTNTTITVLSVIHYELNRLIGYEAISEKKNSCTIKYLQEESLQNFRSILRRVFLLLISTAEDFVSGVKNNDYSLLETIEEKHDTITKFISYCLRIINVKNYPSPRKMPYYFHIISCLENITDIIQHSARDVRVAERNMDKKIIDMLDSLIKNMNIFYNLFYNFSTEKISAMNIERYKIEKMAKELPDKLPKLEINLGHNLFIIHEILFDLIGARSALEYI